MNKNKLLLLLALITIGVLISLMLQPKTERETNTGLHESATDKPKESSHNMHILATTTTSEPSSTTAHFTPSGNNTVMASPADREKKSVSVISKAPGLAVDKTGRDHTADDPQKKDLFITGVVVDDTGNVVDDATLTLQDREQYDRADKGLWSTARTDKFCRFAFKGLRPLEHRLSALSKTNGVAENIQLILQEGKPLTDLKITLNRDLLAISGVTVDEDGNVMPNIKIHVWPYIYRGHFSQELGNVTSDANGEFRIEHLSKGKYCLGLPSEELELVNQWPQIEAGQDNVRLVIRTQKFIHGTVVDPQGQLVSSCNIFLTWVKENGNSQTIPNLVFKDGVFKFKANHQLDSPHGKSMDADPFQLIAIAPNFGKGFSKTITLKEALAEPVRIQLTQGLEQSFLVQDSFGNSLHNVKVNFLNTNEALSDVYGEVTIKNLSPEVVEFHFDLNNYIRKDVTLDLQNGPLTRQTVTMSRGGTLRGYVKNWKDEPMVQATVTLSHAILASHTIKTDQQGEFVIDTLPAGIYRVQVLKANSPFSLEDPQDQVEIKENEVTRYDYREKNNQEQGAIRGRLNFDNSYYIAAELKSLLASTKEQKSRYRVMEFSGNQFEFENVPAGDYSILVIPSGGNGTGSLKKELRLEAGEMLEVVFEENKMFLKARVLDDKGHLLPQGFAQLFPRRIETKDLIYNSLHLIEAICGFTQGDLKIGVAKAGHYQLRIHSGQNLLESTLQPVMIPDITIQENEVLDLGDIQFAKGQPFTATFVNDFEMPIPVSITCTKNGKVSYYLSYIQMNKKLSLLNAPEFPFALNLLFDDYQPLDVLVSQDNPVLTLQELQK